MLFTLETGIGFGSSVVMLAPSLGSKGFSLANILVNTKDKINKNLIIVQAPNF
ncbi:MAG: hypothetical protein HY307_00290 [Arcobacter sp.]|nr:hypothetical protein [Arcobacter sp.]